MFEHKQKHWNWMC